MYINSTVTKKLTWGSVSSWNGSAKYGWINNWGSSRPLVYNCYEGARAEKKRKKLYILDTFISWWIEKEKHKLLK